MFSFDQIDQVVVTTISASRFDATLGQKIKEAIASRMPTDQRFLIDLRQVKLVDSGGLGSLVSLLKTVAAQQGLLGLVGLQAPVRMMFELSRMDRQFRLFKDVSEGLAALA